MMPTSPSVVQKASPLAPQRTSVVGLPEKPETVCEPTGRKVLTSNALSVRPPELTER
jgi:hypothetical protein